MHVDKENSSAKRIVMAMPSLVLDCAIQGHVHSTGRPLIATAQPSCARLCETRALRILRRSWRLQTRDTEAPAKGSGPGTAAV